MNSSIPFAIQNCINAFAYSQANDKNYHDLHLLGAQAEQTLDRANLLSISDAEISIEIATTIRNAIPLLQNELFTNEVYEVVSYYPSRTQPDGAMKVASHCFINEFERPPIILWLYVNKPQESNDEFSIAICIPHKAIADFENALRYDFYGVFERNVNFRV